MTSKIVGRDWLIGISVAFLPNQICLLQIFAPLFGHVVKPGLDWTCKTWTGLICKTWTGLGTIQFVKPGLDSFVKPGLDSFVKPGLDSFVKHGLDSFVKHGLIFSSIDEYIDTFFYSI